MAIPSVHPLAILLLVFTVGPLQTGDDDPMRKERLEKLTAEYGQKLDDYRIAARAAATQTAGEKAEKLRPSVKEFGKRFLALAKERPADEVACDALVWIASNYARREKMELDEALDLIEKHHLGSRKLRLTLDSLASSDSARAKALIVTLIEKGGDRDVRGLACFFLAHGEYGRLDPDGKVEPLMRRVKKDFADVRLEDKTLGKLADGMLFEIKYLIPGKVAPDIEGVDLAAKKMKLSDHRGKVVLLVFWGSWCGPCLEEFPELQKRMEIHFRRPFTVMGVNCGDEKKTATKTIETHKLTWPIFFDGVDGPIAERWNVLSFPTVYVIDDKGVIRCKGGDDIDATIDAAVREAERR